MSRLASRRAEAKIFFILLIIKNKEIIIYLPIDRTNRSKWWSSTRAANCDHISRTNPSNAYLVHVSTINRMAVCCSCCSDRSLEKSSSVNLSNKILGRTEIFRNIITIKINLTCYNYLHLLLWSAAFRTSRIQPSSMSWVPWTSYLPSGLRTICSQTGEMTSNLGPHVLATS